MTQKWTGHEWADLVEAECLARAEAFRAQNSDNGRDALRDWWKTVEALLVGSLVYARQATQPAMSPGALPPDLLNVLSMLAGDLAVGRLSEPVADVVSKGRVVPGPIELHDIRIAVTYRCAAEAGLLSDQSPNKTIVEAYGLGDRTTVQKWRRQYAPFDLAEWASQPVELELKMRACGARYKVAGRSHKAIAGRGRK